MAEKFSRVGIEFPTELLQLTKRAADFGGYILSEYFEVLIKEDALVRLNDQNELKLSNHQYAKFMRACEKADLPSQKLLDAAESLDREGFN